MLLCVVQISVPNLSLATSGINHFQAFPSLWCGFIHQNHEVGQYDTRDVLEVFRRSYHILLWSYDVIWTQNDLIFTSFIHQNYAY